MINEALTGGGGRTEQQRSQSDLLDPTTIMDDSQRKTPKERISMFFKRTKSKDEDEWQQQQHHIHHHHHHHHQQQQQQQQQMQYQQPNDLLVNSSVFVDGINSSSTSNNSVYHHNATQNWSQSHAPTYSPLDHHLSQLHNSFMTSSTIENEHNHNSYNNSSSNNGVAHTNSNSKPSSPVVEKQNNLERQASVRSSSGTVPPPPPGQQQQQQQSATSEITTPAADEGANNNARVLAQLKAELARQRYCLENLEIERQQYRLDSRALTDRIAKVQERLQQRQEARQQLEGNYNEHLRGLRATDDDLASISGKLRQLKGMIAHLADDLLENVDPKRATGALRNFWLNLKQPIEQMGALLPLNRIRMLTEKYMMDYLIPNMTPHFFPGLSVEKDYIALEYWLRNHDRYTATRLRQELAKSVMADAQRLLAKPIKQAAHGLYSNLNEAYPYMQQYDNTESDPEKRYEAKVRKLVEHSIALGFAMKGQEVDIVATVVQEGVQPFNHVTMVDEEGLTSGIIEFCICPPFVIYDTMPYTVLEKGRVFCTAAATPTAASRRT